jgi:uncharacterized protein YndB with AHSA1/START domain
LNRRLASLRGSTPNEDQSFHANTKTADGPVAASAHCGLYTETIWAAWTDSRIVRRWFGSDPNGEVLAAHLDARVGGRFEVTFANGDGTQYTAMGVYRRVEPFRHLEFSWQWKNEPVQTFIRIEMSPEGAGTHMKFEHAGLIHLSTHDYASGWRSTFEKMEKAISSDR